MPNYRTEELRRAANDLADADDPDTRQTSAIAYVVELLRAVHPTGARAVDCVRYVEGLRPDMAYASAAGTEIVPHVVSPEVSRIRARAGTTALLNRIKDTRADLISTVRSARLAVEDATVVEKLIDAAALQHSESLARVYDIVAAQRLERIRHFVESSS